MKKVFLTTLAIIGTFVMANAQRAVEVGVRGGVNLSQVRGDGKGSTTQFWIVDDSRVMGFTGGVYAKIGDKFFVQPELMLSQKGGTYRNTAGVSADFKDLYLDVPVLVGATVGNAVRLNAGPVATLLLSKDQTLLDNLGLTNNDGFRKALIGFQAGVGFNISKVRLDMRYEGNLNDVFDIQSNSQLANQTKGKGNLYFVTVGYAF